MKIQFVSLANPIDTAICIQSLLNANIYAQNWVRLTCKKLFFTSLIRGGSRIFRISVKKKFGQGVVSAGRGGR